MMQEKMAMSVEEAAACTGIGRNTLRELISSRKIPVLRIGRKILIRTDTLERFLQANDGKDLRRTAELSTAEK